MWCIYISNCKSRARIVAEALSDEKQEVVFIFHFLILACFCVLIAFKIKFQTGYLYFVPLYTSLLGPKHSIQAPLVLNMRTLCLCVSELQDQEIWTTFWTADRV